MSLKAQQLLFPVTLWDAGTHPEHAISCVLRADDFMVTGSETGELCYWRRQQLPRLQTELTSPNKQPAASREAVRFRPMAFLIRECAARCTALTSCVIRGPGVTPREVIVAGTAEGFLTLWEKTGGRCIVSLPVLRFAPRHLQHYTVKETTYLACAGADSAEVYLVRLLDLTPVRRLQHGHALAGLQVTVGLNNRPSLLTLTTSGNCHRWDLQFESMDVRAPSPPPNAAAGAGATNAANKTAGESALSPKRPAPINVGEALRGSSLGNAVNVASPPVKVGSQDSDKSGIGSMGSPAKTTDRKSSPKSPQSPSLDGDFQEEDTGEAELVNSPEPVVVEDVDDLVDDEEDDDVDELVEDKNADADAAVQFYNEPSIDSSVAERVSSPPLQGAESSGMPYLQETVATAPQGLAVSRDGKKCLLVFANSFVVWSLLDPSGPRRLFPVHTGFPFTQYMDKDTMVSTSVQELGHDEFGEDDTDEYSEEEEDDEEMFDEDKLDLTESELASVETYRTNDDDEATPKPMRATRAVSTLQERAPPTPKTPKRKIRVRKPSTASRSSSHSRGLGADVYCWAGGEFVGEQSEYVALWTKKGEAAVYLLPSTDARDTPTLINQASHGKLRLSKSSPSVVSRMDKQVAPVSVHGVLQLNNERTMPQKHDFVNTDLPPESGLLLSPCYAVYKDELLAGTSQGHVLSWKFEPRRSSLGLSGNPNNFSAMQLPTLSLNLASPKDKTVSFANSADDEPSTFHSPGKQLRTIASAVSLVSTAPSDSPGTTNGYPLLAPDDVVRVLDGFEVKHPHTAIKKKISDLSLALDDNESHIEVMDLGETEDACTASAMLSTPSLDSADCVPTVWVLQGFESGVIKLLDVFNDRPVEELRGHTGTITSLTSIPLQESVLKCHVLLSTSKDGTIRIWELGTGAADPKQSKSLARCLAVLPSPSAVRLLRWHPPMHGGVWPTRPRPGDTGDVFFAICEDRAVRVYSLLDAACLQTLRGHDSMVQVVFRDSWCVASDQLITQSQRGTVYMWTLSSGDLERVLPGPSGTALLVSRNLHSVATQRGLQAYRAARHMQEHKHVYKKPSSIFTSATSSAAASSAPLPAPASAAPASPPNAGTTATAPPSGVTSPTRTPSRVLSSGNLSSQLPALPVATANTPTAAQSRAVAAAQAASRTSSALQTALKRESVRVMTFWSHHLHCTMYVVSVNRLLKDVHRATLLAQQAAGKSQSQGNSSTEMALRGNLLGLLSSFFDWGLGGGLGLDKVLKGLGMRAPEPGRSFGVMSDKGQALCALVPVQSNGLGRWSFDPMASASQALCVAAVCMSLLRNAEPKHQGTWGNMMAMYNVVLPDLPVFVELEPALLASYIFSGNEDVRTSSRLLLQGVVERAPYKESITMFKKWAAYFELHPASIANIEAGKQPPVPDEELLTAATLALIAIHDSSFKQLQARKKNEESEAELARMPSASTSGSSGSAASKDKPKGGAAVSKSSSGHSEEWLQVGSEGAANEAISEEFTKVIDSLLLEGRGQLLLESYTGVVKGRRGKRTLLEIIASAAGGDWRKLGQITVQPLNAAGVPDSVAQAVLSDFSMMRQETDPDGKLRPKTGWGGANIHLPRPGSQKEALTATIHQPRQLSNPNLTNQITASASRQLSNPPAATGSSSSGGGGGSSSSSSSALPTSSSALASELRALIKEHSANITNTLLKVLFQPLRRSEEPTLADALRTALAADLLGKGFSLWRRHIPDLLLVLRRLHKLTMVRHQALHTAAQFALLQAGDEAPSYFVTCMGKEALNTRNRGKERSGALVAIVALVRKYPTALAQVLPTAVQIITRCLDPSKPLQRKELLLSATAALHALVQKYPMVAFHQVSQKFAVGTGRNKNSVIIIYDLRTATTFRILSGHTGQISAVCFDPKGSNLVSYSADEKPPTVRIWSTGASGFVSSFFGVQAACTEVYKLHSLDTQYPITMHLQNCRLVWTSPGSVTLTREDKSQLNFALRNS
eukprot:g27890.t1